MGEFSIGGPKDAPKINMKFFNEVSGNNDAVEADSSPKKRCTNEGFNKGGVENRPLHSYRASNTTPQYQDIQDDGDQD